MSEPVWDDALRNTVEAWVVGGFLVREGAYRALLPHIEAAYARGLQAGRSQAGYRTTRKKKEPPCPTSPSVPSAPGSSASAAEAEPGTAP